MNSILISPANSTDLQMVLAWLEAQNIAATLVADIDKEELGLGLLMQQAAKEPKVSREEVMRALGRA